MRTHRIPNHVATAALLASALLSAVPASAHVEYVIQISVDGLASNLLLTRIDTPGYENLKRLRDEGASTFEARIDYTQPWTNPNHASMINGRPAEQPAGAPNTLHHGFLDNGEPSSSWTYHGPPPCGSPSHCNPNVSYIASTFDVAHDNGLLTALYASKSKFVIMDWSYDGDSGAPDTTGPDDGTDKIDFYVNKESGSPLNGSEMQADFLADMAANRFNYTFLHYRDPDSAGHANGWGSAGWNTSVQNVDDYLGEVLDLVETDPLLNGHTVIILTADHGGSGSGHSDPSVPSIYTIPFFVWGAGVEAGADLYALNPTSRQDPTAPIAPGGSAQPRPDYNAPGQPIRDGDGGNLALHLLGLPSIPGSIINAGQDLHAGQTTDPFTAFNDCVHDGALSDTDPQGTAVHYKDPNTTVYGIGTICSDCGSSGAGTPYPVTSGRLIDVSSGQPTGVTATLTQNGGVSSVNWQSQVGPTGSPLAGTWGGGYDAQSGSDAHSVFNGFADMTGTIFYGGSGWWVDLQLSGLDPAKTYTFVTSASRAKANTDGAPGYDTRNSLYTLSGADAATNTSSTGVIESGGNPLTLLMNTGNNHVDGRVIRWDGIDPGPDGSVTIRAESEGVINQAYAFDVFMLEESVSGCGDGVLDVGEDCDNGAGNGTAGQCCSATCSFESVATECRVASDVCDAAEQCTGADAACPADGFVSGGTECRAAADQCDVAEQCTGAAPSCPTDGFVPDTTACDDGLTCTSPDVCTTGVCAGSDTCTGGQTCHPGQNMCVAPPTNIAPLASYSNAQESSTSDGADTDTFIAAGSLVSGVDHLVIYNAGYGGAGTADDVGARVEYGATVIGRSEDQGSSSGTPEAVRTHQLSGFAVISGTGADELRIKHQVSSGTGFIGGKGLVAVPLDALSQGSDYFVTQHNDDAAETSSSGSFTDVRSATFDLPDAGDYLVLASMEATMTAGATSGGAAMRLQIGGVTQKMEWAKEWETDNQSQNFAYARIHSLSAGNTTFALQGGTSQGSSTAGFRRSRIIVLRAASFDQLVSTTTDAQSTTAATFETSGGELGWDSWLTNTYTPNQVEDVVVIGNGFAWQGQDFRSTAARLENTTDATVFSEFTADDAKNIAVDRVTHLVTATEQIGAAKTYAFQLSNEDNTTTDSQRQYGDVIVWSMTLTAPPAVCGDGNLDGGEQCDDGGTAPGDCCSPSCTFESAATECRAAADVCDTAETCTGVTGTCPADAFEPVTTLCRASGGLCDVAETCSGAGPSCPADGFLPAASACRAAAGACDVADTCSGSAPDCPDVLVPAATECRASAGICDVAEACTGADPACPTDGFELPTTECRAKTGLCDVADTCTGSDPACPADGYQSAGFVCRAVQGLCDVEDTCSGVQPTCPNVFEPATTECRASSAPCDAADFCSGTASNCPNLLEPAGAECRAAADVCDVAELCDGATTACPADGFEPATTECRAQAGQCDVAELCSGSGSACPADGFAPDSTPCDDALTCTNPDLCTAGVCTSTDTCTGGETCDPGLNMCTGAGGCGDGVLDVGEDCDNGAGNGTSGQCCSATCSFEPGATECRPKSGACDVADLCTGADGECPNVFQPAGLVCRAKQGLCDIEDQCSGTQNNCPNAFEPVTTQCRVKSGACDVADFCPGTASNCPNGVRPDGHACRPGTATCEGDEVCDGIGQACPPLPNPPLDCDDDDLCTADGCDVITGCFNTPVPSCVTDVWNGTLKMVEVDDGTGLYEAAVEDVTTFSGDYAYSATCNGSCNPVPSPPDGVNYVFPDGLGSISGLDLTTDGVDSSVLIEDEHMVSAAEAALLTALGYSITSGTIIDTYTVSSGTAGSALVWEVGFLYVSTDPFPDTAFTSTPPANPDFVIFEIDEGAGTVYHAFGVMALPEPGSSLMLGSGILGLLALSRRRARR